MGNRYRDFAPQSVLPSTWTDAVEDVLSGHAGGNLKLTVASATTIQATGGTDQDRATLVIGGKPRWVEANVVATVSGAAGSKDVWATTGPDSFTIDNGDETDTTDHAFGLKIGGTPSGSGAETHFRKIGEVDWDGAKITGLRQLFGPWATAHTVAAVGQNADVPPVFAKGAPSQAKLLQLADSSGVEQAAVSGGGVVDAKTGYKINGTDFASTHLSDSAGIGRYQSGTLSGRPAANAVPAGTFYRATDGPLSMSNGATWQLLREADPTVVTSLPGSPYTGQRVVLQTSAMATAKVRWVLCYTGVKWEFEGGAPLYAFDATARALATSSSPPFSSGSDFASDSLSIAIPLSGDYLIEWGASVDTTVQSTSLYMAPVATGLAWAIANTAIGRVSSGTASPVGGTLVLGGAIRAAGVSGTLKLQYATDVFDDPQAVNRWLKLTPVAL